MQYIVSCLQKNQEKQQRISFFIIMKFHTATPLYLFVCLFVFVALRPMSTAMVIVGRSVHLTTLFPGQA